MNYQPGDSFDVFCPNKAEEVDEMLCRLGLQDQKNHRVLITLRKDTKKKGKLKSNGIYFHIQFRKLMSALIIFL